MAGPMELTPAARQSASESIYSGLPGRSDGPADAYRHLLWAAELTRRYGETIANAILDAHETFTSNQTAQRQAMDDYNNSIGVEIGNQIRQKNNGSWEDVIAAARQKMSEAAASPNEFDGALQGAQPLNNGIPAWFVPDQWTGNPKFGQTELPIEQLNWPPVWPSSKVWDEEKGIPLRDWVPDESAGHFESLPPPTPAEEPRQEIPGTWRNEFPTDPREELQRLVTEPVENVLSASPTAETLAAAGRLLAEETSTIAKLLGVPQGTAELVGERLLGEVSRAAAAGLEALSEIVSGALEALKNSLGGTGGSGGFLGSEKWPEWFKKLFDNAESTTISPIILDLDGDGVRTSAVGAGVYFDFEADGFAESTGWASIGDGLLALDRNGNGRIDSGRELFGNQTQLANGSFAPNGFQALAEFDANLDGVIDGNDAAYANLRVWIDANGDGYTEAGELVSLSDAGVASIATSYTNSSLVDAAGNEHRQVGSFTRTNGTTGAAEDVWFKRDLVDSFAEDWVPVSASIAALPDLRGYGIVYDLDQAMARDGSNTLQSLVQTFAAQTSVTDRNATFEQILFKWAGVDAVASGSRGGYIDARKLGVLEKFFAQQYVGSNGSTNPAYNTGPMLYGPYQGLFEMFYAQLMAQTHLQGLYDKIAYRWDAVSQTLTTDFAAVKTEIQNQLALDPVAGAVLAGEFARSVKALQGAAALDIFYADENLAWVMDTYRTPQTLGTAGSDSLTGTAADDAFWGSDGDDVISAGAGSNVIYGNAGDDTLGVGGSSEYRANTFVGGLGNDTMTGASGADTYVFRRGDGQDTINDVDNYQTAFTDTIALGTGITKSDVSVRGIGNDLVLKIADPANPAATDQVTIKNWDLYNLSYYQRIELVQFADGGEWTAADLTALSTTTTEGADDLTLWSDVPSVDGKGGDDTIRLGSNNATAYGGAGNDTITSSGSNDTIDGGAGNDTINDQGAGANVLRGGDGNDTVTFSSSSSGDTLEGGAGDDVLQVADLNNNLTSRTNTFIGGPGNDWMRGGTSTDTYVFNRGDGQDTISDFDNYQYGGVDKLVFGAGIAPTDITATRSGANMVLKINDPSNPSATDQVTLEGWASFGIAYFQRLERFEFADGTVWTQANLNTLSMTATDAAETITLWPDATWVDGKGGDDTIVSGSNNATVYGGDGNDTITDSGGSDTIDGGAGNDTINDQGTGANVLRGGDGNDTVTFSSSSSGNTLEGGAGNDVLQVADLNNNLTSRVNTFIGGPGNDWMRGGTSTDTYMFNRGDGQDTISDFDNYQYNGVDRLVFGAGIAPSDLIAMRSGANLVLNVNDPGNPSATDQITFEGWANFGIAYYQRIERIEFADSTVWTPANLNNLSMTGTAASETLTLWADSTWADGGGGDDTITSGSNNSTVYGGDGNDTITDSGGSDTLDGGNGNDTITFASSSTGNVIRGGAGNDVLQVANLNNNLTSRTNTFIGGPGNDWMRGGTSTDTYIFNRGDGQDTISDFDNYQYGGVDKLVFGAGIAPSDITATRSGANLVLKVSDPTNPAATDQVTLEGWDNFGGPTYYQRVERIEFADGTVWTPSNIYIGDANVNALTGSAGADIMNGGLGNDTINGAAGSDVLYGDAGNDTINAGDGNDVVHGGDGADTTNGDNGDDIASGDAGADNVSGGGGNDYVAGGTENDTVDGGDGNDVAQGGADDDQVQGGAGNDLLTGDAGNDTLNGGDGNDFLAGGAGDDSVTTGDGWNVVSYNAGGGIDTVYSADTASNTLSLGGGIRYSDLSLSKDGNDLHLHAGGVDEVVLKDWYAGKNTVDDLQIILDASVDFDANSSDQLYNKKVQNFDFQGLVSEFDNALAQSPGLTSWALTNALLQFHLSGSDESAFGGDLAYWYGKNGSLAGMGLTSAQQVIGASGFGSDAQTLQAFNGLQEGLVKLA